jgi:hypothetical protein
MTRIPVRVTHKQVQDALTAMGVDPARYHTDLISLEIAEGVVKLTFFRVDDGGRPVIVRGRSFDPALQETVEIAIVSEHP